MLHTTMTISYNNWPISYIYYNVWNRVFSKSLILLIAYNIIVCFILWYASWVLLLLAQGGKVPQEPRVRAALPVRPRGTCSSAPPLTNKQNYLPCRITILSQHTWRHNLIPFLMYANKTTKSKPSYILIGQYELLSIQYDMFNTLYCMLNN